VSGKYCNNLREIQRSDQKLWPFRTGTLVWRVETSASPSSGSTSTPRKTASGKSYKILRAIQRSDQKLWPFRSGTLVCRVDTSASSSSDSISTASFTVISGGRFHCSTYGIPTRWRGGLVAPDRYNSWRGPQLLIRPLERAQSLTVVSGGRFPCRPFRFPTRWKGGLVAPDRNNIVKEP